MSASGPETLCAPAKLTLSLRVLGTRPDGYHDIEAEMVSLDLADTLVVSDGGDGVEVDAGPSTRAAHLEAGAPNIVARALRATGRSARVLVHKRIPVGGGLGGGSSDAAAILRWAKVVDPSVAASLGADVPFCVVGGRAQVGGIGERVTPLAFRAATYLLLVPPFGMDTPAVYRQFDRLARRAPAAHPGAVNDLEEAAIAVEPRLAVWRDVLRELTGVEPALAGSGSTWWVEGSAEALGCAAPQVLERAGDQGLLLEARTVPSSWAGPLAKS